MPVSHASFAAAAPPDTKRLHLASAAASPALHSIVRAAPYANDAPTSHSSAVSSSSRLPPPAIVTTPTTTASSTTVPSNPAATATTPALATATANGIGTNAAGSGAAVVSAGINGSGLPTRAFSRAGSDTDVTLNGPLSTSIDTLVVDPTRDATLLQEDLDVSQGNLIASIRVHDLSARINALANDLLAEDTLHPGAEPRTSSDLPAPFRPPFRKPARPSHDVGGRRRAERPAPARAHVLDAVAHHQLAVTSDDDSDSRLHHLRFVHDDDDEDDEDDHDDDNDDDDDRIGVGVSDDYDEYDDQYDHDHDHGHNHVVEENHIDDIDREPDDGLDLPPPPVGSGDRARGVRKSVEKTAGLEPLYMDDVPSESLKPFRRFDLFDRQSGATEALDASVASGGSDQVDSTNMLSRHTPARLEESPHMPFDTPSLSFDRRFIPEEADDRHTYISDYLRELKDSVEFEERRRELESDAEGTTGLNVGGDAPSRAVEEQAKPHAGFTVSPSSPLDEAHPNRLRAGVPGSYGADGLPTAAVASADPAAVAPGRDGVKRRAGHESLRESVERDMPLSSNMLQAATSPYRQMRHVTKPVVLDVSPFADADNDMEGPGEAMTKTSLRDEYEAYDEYIVCEYEVEEQVDEYDSDALSRSRGFMTTVYTESAAPVRTASARSMLKDRSSDMQLTGDMGDGADADPIGLGGVPRVRAETERRGGGNTLAAMASTPVLTPNVEAHVLQWRHRRPASPRPGQVRRVLRKIKMPIRAVRRRVGGNGCTGKPKERGGAGGEDDGTDADTLGKGTAPTSEVDTESARVRRKETLKTVLRKRPALQSRQVQMQTQAQTQAQTQDQARMQTQGPEQTAGHGVGVGVPREVRSDFDASDEQSARVGRKETLRAVLRKIPVPKNYRRSSAGEPMPGSTIPHHGTQQKQQQQQQQQRQLQRQESRQREEEVEATEAQLTKTESSHSRQRETSGLLSKSSSAHGKGGGPLQAVLQRLPSLSGASRDRDRGAREHRASAPPDVIAAVAAAREEREALLQTQGQPRAGMARRASLGREEWQARRFSGAADDAGDTAAACERSSVASSGYPGPESPQLREDSLFGRQVYDGDVWVKGLSRMPGKGKFTSSASARGEAGALSGAANRKSAEADRTTAHQDMPSRRRASLRAVRGGGAATAHTEARMETTFAEDGVGRDDVAHFVGAATDHHDDGPLPGQPMPLPLLRMGSRAVSMAADEGDAEARRRSRRKRRDDAAPTAGSTGAHWQADASSDKTAAVKMSLAAMGERIFSRFKTAS